MLPAVVTLIDFIIVPPAGKKALRMIDATCVPRSVDVACVLIVRFFRLFRGFRMIYMFFFVCVFLGDGLVVSGQFRLGFLSLIFF